MDPEAAKLAEKYAGKAGKKFESLTDPPKPEIDLAEKAKLANTALRTTKFLSQEAYFNPDKINDYGRREAGPEIELFDPDTRIPVARIAREPKSGGPAIWQSSSYNPDLEYQQVTKDGYISEIDPQTGREVARTANLVGGADDGEIPPTKPPAPDGAGGGDLPPSGPSAPASAEGGGDGPDNPYDRLNYVELEQTLADKQAALAKAEQDISVNPLLARLPKIRQNVDNLRTEASQIEDSKNRLFTDEEASEIIPDFDALVELEVDYQLREGQPLSTATGPEREAYDKLQAYLQAENAEMPNIFTNPRLEGAIQARYQILKEEYQKQFGETLTPPTDETPTESPTVPPAGPPSPDDRRDDDSPDRGVPPTAPAGATETLPEDEPDEPGPDDSSPTPPDVPPTGPTPPPTVPPSGVSITPADSESHPGDPLHAFLEHTTRYQEEQREVERQRQEAAERHHQEQLRVQQEAMEASRQLQQQLLDATERNRQAALAKDYPHDEYLLNENPEDPKWAVKYIEDKLFDYEHAANGVTDAKIKELRERMVALGGETERFKELIDVLDARKLLQEAAGNVPVEGNLNVDKWEESMKGLFVLEGFYVKLLIGGKWVDSAGNEITDVNLIATNINRPLEDRDIEWKRSENVPGLQEAMSILQNETHPETMEVDEIDFRSTPPRLTGNKTEITTVCNFFQGDSSFTNLTNVKKIYQGYLQARPRTPGTPKLTPKQAETAIHLAERLLRVTLIGAQMNGPLRKAPQIEILKDGKLKSVENYNDRETQNLADRRIKIALTSKNNAPTTPTSPITSNNAPILIKADAADAEWNKRYPGGPPPYKAKDSEWDQIYRGTHPDIKIDTDGNLSGVTKGRGTIFREALYYPSFLEQRNIGGYPELRRLANLRAADFLSHFTDAAEDTSVGEVVDFDKFIQTYSNFTFGNKQNILNFWVDNIKNAMDKRSLFYSDPKESSKSVSGLAGDPVSLSNREKVLDQDIDWRRAISNTTKGEQDTREAEEKFQKTLIEMGSDFASKYFVAYSGLPKNKVKNLIWLEQQYLEFITSPDIGKKYFHHRSPKAKGVDLYFYLGTIGRKAFEYGFYKNEIIQNINQDTEANIYDLHQTITEEFEPSKVPTGNNFLTNGSGLFNMTLRWMGGDKFKK